MKIRSIRSSFLVVVSLLMLSGAALVGKTLPLPFIPDDYPKGLAEGKLRNLPMFVEVWAPW
jgi:hypothetical protein